MLCYLPAKLKKFNSTFRDSGHAADISLSNRDARHEVCVLLWRPRPERVTGLNKKHGRAGKKTHHNRRQWKNWRKNKGKHCPVFTTGKAAISQRIKELDQEWDIERALEVNMPIVALIGLSLTVFVSPWWAIFPTLVLLFFYSMPFRDGAHLCLLFECWAFAQKKK